MSAENIVGHTGDISDSEISTFLCTARELLDGKVELSGLETLILQECSLLVSILSTSLSDLSFINGN